MISFLGKWLLSYQHLGVFQKKHSTPDGQTNIDTKRHALLLFRDLGTSYQVQRQLARQRPAERKQIAKIHRDKDRQTQRIQTLSGSPGPLQSAMLTLRSSALTGRGRGAWPDRSLAPSARSPRPAQGNAGSPTSTLGSGGRHLSSARVAGGGGPGPAPRDRSGRTRGRWGRRRGWGQWEGFGRPGPGAGGRTGVGQSWLRAQASGAGSGPRGSRGGREGCPGHCGVRGRGQ